MNTTTDRNIKFSMKIGQEFMNTQYEVPMATKLERGGVGRGGGGGGGGGGSGVEGDVEVLVAGPLKKELFCGLQRCL